ncbi:MAG: hypothetical protein II800_04290 [Lachnospiraceae bacterium]|nr:hypothetical protein [Lachnospiraceae bacterium]
MANINPIMNHAINQVQNPVQNPGRQAETVRPVREDAGKIDQPERRQPEIERPEAADNKPERVERQPERELDHVIAVSKDGDTVQASDEAIRELDEEEQDGRVIGDPANAQREVENGSESRQELLELELERSAEIREAQIEAAQEEHEERREEALQGQPNAVLADEEETIAEEGQINSFIGYSDAELERLVLQGDISRTDYNKEMESREAKEEAREEELADFSLESTRNNAERTRAQMQEREIEAAFSDEANETLNAGERAQVLQAMQRIASAQPPQDPNQIEAPLQNISLG